MSPKTVGFIGLGIMGLPMAKNLIEEGYQVIGHNRSNDPIEELVEYGGEDGKTPMNVATECDVVLLCLPDSPNVEDVILGSEKESDPLIDGLSDGMTVIDHSTISPTMSKNLAEEISNVGSTLLDAPISGGEENAVEGSLTIMVGGDEKALTDQRDILKAVGSSITHCGPIGAGQTAKACNQIIVAAQMIAVSEAMLLADQAGANPEAVVDAISGGAADCWVLNSRVQKMIDSDFEPGFFGEYHYKDLRIATDAGQAFGAPMPTATTAHELYKVMVQNGMGKQDTSGIIQVLEGMAGKTE